MATVEAHGRIAPTVTDLHLHLEGSLAIGSTIEIARGSGHPWGELDPAALRRRFRVRSFAGFLDSIKETCRILCSSDALGRAARELSGFLARYGVRYAEVYASPWIYVRWGMNWDAILDAVDEGFAEGERAGGARCAILLDTVRQWGVDPADAILDDVERRPRDRVVGFGIGGEESVPLREFVRIFDRARALGLRTVAHAGELGPARDVAEALDLLRVDRIAHGIRALDDPGLVAEIARRRIPLDLAITSNYRTGAVVGPHPIRELVDAGVIVTIGTDDPAIFGTNPIREMRRARRAGNLSRDEIHAVARDAVDASFCGDDTRARLHEVLDQRQRETA